LEGLEITVGSSVLGNCLITSAATIYRVLAHAQMLATRLIWGSGGREIPPTNRGYTGPNHRVYAGPTPSNNSHLFSRTQPNRRK
jgi:hypothetical protein